MTFVDLRIGINSRVKQRGTASPKYFLSKMQLVNRKFEITVDVSERQHLET